MWIDSSPVGWVLRTSSPLGNLRDVVVCPFSSRRWDAKRNGSNTARKPFVFRQFHTEGFVNTYVQQPTADEKTIAFVSEAIENIPPGYRRARPIRS
jgi:hypothetical protein